MNNRDLEERASLHGLGLLEEREEREFLLRSNADPAARQLRLEFEETGASLVYEAPQLVPPAHLKNEILYRLTSHRETPRLILFPLRALPYAIAAGLAALAIYQMNLILGLKTQLASARAEQSRSQETGALMALKLATLEAKDPAYTASHIVVAWDPRLNRGLVTMQNLPAAPAGHDYQLWVLDPGAPFPVSAGLLSSNTRTEGFAVPPVRTPGPGFAISLESSGGAATPGGPILFAVAPGQ